MRQFPRRTIYTYEQRVAACADYLIGMSCADLEFKHKIAAGMIGYWIKRRGCFKLRKVRDATSNPKA